MDWKTRDIELRGSYPDNNKRYRELKKEFPNITRDEVRNHANGEDPKETKKRRTFNINKDGSQTSDGIPLTEQEMRCEETLLEKHGFVPTEEWEIVSAKSSEWETQIKGGNVETLYASKVTAKPYNGLVEKDVLEHFIKQAEKYSPVTTRTIKQHQNNVLVINICDLHIGQLSWGEESGENYDYKIATQRFKKIIQDVITKSPFAKYEKIYFIKGNDFFNTDNEQASTTAGTPQANDVRPTKMFNKGTDLLIWGIDALRTAFPTTPIETLLVLGNHSTLTMYHASKVLYAWFRNDDTVTIDTSPKLHKGIEYGATALLFTHGQADLKNLDWVYTEFRHLIGATKTTEIHAGHQHKIKVEEKNGAIIRVNPAPVALDNWSYKQGYGALSRTITRVYSKDGLEYELYSRA